MNDQKSSANSRKQRPPAPVLEPNRRIPPDEDVTDIKLLLVAFRSGEAVDRHPELQSWLDEGWTVRDAVPRVVESGATRLLVILERTPEPASEEKRLSSPSEASSGSAIR